MKEVDKLAAKAFFESGFEGEKKVIKEYADKHDFRKEIWEEYEKDKEVSYTERKRKARENLVAEYLRKKEQLESKKKNLLERQLLKRTAERTQEETWNIAWNYDGW